MRHHRERDGDTTIRCVVCGESATRGADGIWRYANPCPGHPAIIEPAPIDQRRVQIVADILTQQLVTCPPHPSPAPTWDAILNAARHVVACLTEINEPTEEES